MSGNRTFTMIKPDAVQAGNIGNIIQMITDAGFSIKAMKLTNLSKNQVSKRGHVGSIAGAIVIDVVVLDKMLHQKHTGKIYQELVAGYII